MYCVLNVTCSRNRGHFPQNSDCELDIPADSVKSTVHARENRLTLACYVPKLQSYEFHTRTYFVSRYLRLPVAKRPESPYSTGSRYTCTMFVGYYSVARQLSMAMVVHLVVFVNV